MLGVRGGGRHSTAVPPVLSEGGGEGMAGEGMMVGTEKYFRAVP